MNKYIIEDNFDFFKELNDTNSLSDENKCMISHTPLTYNSITLPCKHSFNYLPIYTELCLHNDNKSSICCPYCRSITDKFIPFIPLLGVSKVIGVNSPEKKCMPAPRCSAVLIMGARKGKLCGHNGLETVDGTFCEKHLIKQIWTKEMDDLMKAKSVIELKQMCRDKGLKVSGVKKDLVKRLTIIKI